MQNLKIMSWKKALQQGHEIVLATSWEDKPHAIVVISLGFCDNKLLIGACQMKTTLENIKKNNKVCIVAKYNNEYYRIKGAVSIYSSGKYLETAIERSEPPLPHHALVIEISEVFDLDKGKKIL